MNYFDIIIAIPLIWGVYKGFKKGLIIEIASLVALGVGLLGGIKFSHIVALHLSEIVEVSDKIISLLAFTIIFIAIVVIVFLLAKLLQRFVKMIALGMVNRISGAIFGMLKFGLIISVVLNIINTINGELNFIKSEKTESSILYQPVSCIAPAILPRLKELNFNAVAKKVEGLNMN